MIFNVLEEISSIVRRPLFFTTQEQRHSLDNMHTCRTIERGGRILECPNCTTRSVVFNPCNNRGCPECYRRNQILWKEKVQKKLIPTSHYHLVFSMPQAYVITWLRNKNRVMNCMFKIVNKVITELSNEFGLLMGCVLSFQSHGRGMCYKPHMHCILSAGGLNDKNEWIEIGTIRYTQIEDRFHYLMYRELALQIAVESLPVTKDIDNTEWHVHPEYHEKTGNHIAGYLSHTSCGAVINLKQSFQINGEKIPFTEMHNGKELKTELLRTTFVERYLNHIPPSGAVTVRYYGLYSNKNSERLKEAKKKFPVNNIEVEKEEIVDLCPECFSRMKVVLLFPADTSIEYIKMLCKQGPPAQYNVLIK